MIDAPKLVWGAANWLPLAATAAAILLALLVVGYARASAGGAAFGVRLAAAALKTIGVLVLALCLLEPLSSGARARPGANQFVILADNSQSMTLRERAGAKPRGDQLKALLKADAAWLSRLGKDFDLRQYAFDSQLRAVKKFDDDLTLTGGASNLGAALDRLARRFQGRPLAGVFLLTDGSATDADTLSRLLAQSAANGTTTKLPPIYPVLIGRQGPPEDVSLGQVAVAQTNFEDTPVTLNAQVTTAGYKGRTVVAQLLDESGKKVDEQKLPVATDTDPLGVRFRLKPEKPGISFYRLRVAADDQLDQFDHPDKVVEATLANNARTVVVDRGKGPYRVLYVAGRPNWEFKFLQRALEGDDQVQLMGLLRVAKREPKFNFLSKAGESSNPLFRGFDNPNKQQVEQYDQPVLIRMGKVDEAEVKGGFPKSAEDLYHYHAIVIDDLEAEFFNQDQLQLLKDFVRQRGGGLLMLGGQETFRNGRYDRTPVGDVLPVYADDAPVPATGPSAQQQPPRYRLALTREGWLEPWVRLRPDEEAERKRLDAMPQFQTLNTIRGIKPGASVLARAMTDDGQAVPALVEHRFGHGRAAALLLGDLWRWGLRRPENDKDNDLEKAWRQTIRWLVADVPGRVELTASPRRGTDDPDGALTLSVQVRDPAYAPLDNATVTIKVTGPDGKPLDLRAEPDPKQPGRYDAAYVPRQGGAYRAQAVAAAPDGSDVGAAETGWASDPAAEEFKNLQPNADLMQQVARATGGQVVDAADLDSFVATLPSRNAPITEPYVKPLWHQSWVFALAILCLCAEWGLRRWKGLP